MQRRRIQRRASGHSPGDGSYLPLGYSYPNVNLQYPGLSRHSQLPEGYSFPVFQSPSVVQPQATVQWSAGFPAGRPFPVAVVGMEAVESAAAKAYQNLVASRENVSACKVSQSALAALNVDSWNSLGFHPQDVPTFQRLFHMEGKVNAFIHCFACAQKITTLHELEVSLCQYEGVKRFEELGLGPFLRHPLVKHYFGVSEDTTEVFRITSEDIIFFLQTFMRKFKKSFTVDEFLKFIAEQKSIPIKEKLGVRIQDMGFYLHHIREASKAEHNLLEKEIYEPNVQFGRTEEKISGSGPPNISSEKKILDKQFSYISSRVKNFTSICKVYDISDDSNEANEDDIYSDSECGKKDTSTKNYQTISDVKGCKPVSSCPYPSKTEEMTRLGLKPVDSHKTTPVSTCGINKEIKRPRRKKRRKLGSNSDAGSFCKVDRKVEVVESTSDHHICDFTLQNSDIDKFVATWKVISKECSISEMLDMMLNYYIKDVKKRKRVKRVASSYPVIGMLNVSMLSMKHGMLGNIYDTFQALNDKELMVANSVATGEVIEVLPMVEVDERTTHLDSRSCVTIDYIIKKIINYFENYQLTPNKESWSPEKQFQAFKKLYDCEIWLIAQFNAHEFCSLGHGHFYDFLENHIKILPFGVRAVLSQLRFQASSVEVFLIQHQLGVMLSQADGNLMPKVGTTFDIVSLLNKQYPAACFCMSGKDPQNYFEGLMSQQKENANSCCVLFSSCLVGNQQIQNSLIKREYSSQVQQCSLSRTSIDALTCLLNAPMLADLLFWSHWDLLYAPSLGPLQNFLFKKVNCKNLLCVATVNGKFVRVDHTATVDEFLEAFIQCSPFNIALKLLSLICLYRGINNAPLALLKCFVQKAVDVIIQNSTDFAETNSGGRNCLPGQIVLGINKFSESCEESKFSAGLCGVDSAIVTLSKTILECLILLPSEFRSFAAEIFLSGFRSVSKEAPIVILNQCCRADEQIMLHDIGLSLGVTEWVTDQHFSSTSSTDGVSVAPQTIKQFSNNSFLASVPEFSASGNQKNNLQKMGDDLVAGNDMYFSGAICLAPKKQAHCHSTRKSSINSEEQTLHDADAIVESIRHEEFGLNSNSNMTEDSLLKKQHARLGRALHCLSQELYSQDSHFILELVQNADDNIYVAGLEPELVFILQESGIIVLNNEVGFSTENIRALCDVGNSTKKGSSGYIGKKGIGFKSVFRVTDAPEIHSNGFHVKFDITEGQIGFILPTVIPPCDSNIFKHYLRSEDYQGKDIAWNTTILLPFRPQSKESTGVCSIMSMFSDLHPSLLLFLHRLRCIKFRNLLTDKLTVMRKETLQDGIVKISHGEEVMSFLVISKKLRSSIIRSDVESTDISLAFTLQESNCGVYEPILKNQPVFSFLPLRNYGLKFILQGDFVLPSSREEVDGDSAWNQWLLSEFPALFLSAEQSFCALPYFLKNHGKAVSIYMSFVPLVGEVHGFFSQLPQMLISLLRTSNCLLQDSPDLKWVLPCRVLRGWNEQARVLLSDNLLQKHIGLVYLHKDINLSDSLASTLGIRDFGPKVLVEVISSVCRSPENLESLGTDWLSAWFFTVYTLLNMNISRNSFLNDELEKDLIDDLRNIPLIPLTDGSYGFVADGPIWLPCNVLNKGSNDGYHPEDFPCLYSKLRIVTPQLFSVTTKNAYSVEAIKADSVMQMLIKIGVQQLSAHEVIRSHILVAFSEELTPKDRDLMIEYLSFIMLHLQSDCVTCQSEKQEIITELQKLPVLVTSYGYKCPSKEPIHFGREYGNPVDVTVLFDSIDIEWIELDISYLTHPSARSLLSGLTKWRSFFLDLGVTDFVQVICTDKKVEDFISDGAAEVGNFNSPTSFVKDWESPELVNLLSVFSSKKFRKKCIYLLEILDKMWDESYSAKTRSLIISNTDGSKKPVFSSFLKCINQFSWVASTLDRRLHQPKKLFYDCEQVCSVLGSTCPYAVPKVNSNVFARDLGFKMEVTIDDAVEILQLWRMSKVPFVASISQMLKFYTLLSSASKSSSSGIFKKLISSNFIFIPYFTNSKSNHASGMFVSTKEVYWRDPTCCVDWIREEMLLHSSGHMGNQILCHSLEIAYPTLHDFFVNVCGVSSTPPFCSYIQILQYLSIVALPSQAAHKVFQVLVRWANDIKLGLVTSDQIRELKEYVVKFENTILPTEQDKWVSLHPSFGLICWPDDEELKKQFKHTDGVDFIQFGELNVEDKAVLSRCVATIFRIIGVPALSEIVFRKAIFNGKEDSGDKVSLVNWVLPYAQRYIHKLHLDRYLVLKQLGFEKISELQLVVVSKLFYKYTLQGRDSSSKQKVLCNCLLQDNILYVCSTSDVHSMFFELSRFFFNGTAELHLANFLHMVTTMAQSGSTDEQIEYFIVNSQRIPKLPENEPFWSISYACPETYDSIPDCPIDPKNGTAKSSHKKPGITSYWPPTDWKTAPGFENSQRTFLMNSSSYDCSPDHVTKKAGVTVEDPFCFGITGDWALEEGEVPENASVVQESQLICTQSYTVGPSDSALEPTYYFEERDIPGRKTSFTNPAQLLIDQQLRRTGRLGEELAYQFFIQKHGPSEVQWVNEETETGKPYDLIVGEHEKTEYIEVKATRIASKDWFDITMSEWKFAAEKGDSYSIAHVSISESRKAKITVLRNPYNLCRRNVLSIALFMSKRGF